MAKDPAFLFYPNDYLGGTMGMSFEEKGAYIELLMMQFNRGHMTEHMIGQMVGHLWDKLKVKFIQDDKGLWYNQRLDEEKTKRMNFTQSRRNNVLGVNQYTKKEENNVGHMTEHMENENEDVIVNKNRSKKILIPEYPEFIEYALEKKPNVDKQALKLKYDSWIENGWKDGNNSKIVNWKSKLLNTLPHIKEQEKQEVDKYGRTRPSKQHILINESWMVL